MAILVLPHEGEKAYVQLYNSKSNDKLDRFISSKEWEKIRENLSAALNPSNSNSPPPFDQPKAFFSPKIFPNEIAALLRYYKKRLNGFKGLMYNIVRVRKDENNWVAGWGLVAFTGDDDPYHVPGAKIIVCCFPFDDDIPPLHEEEDYDKFETELENIELVGKKISARLAEIEKQS